MRIVFSDGSPCAEVADMDQARVLLAMDPALVLHPGDVLEEVKAEARQSVVTVAEAYGERLTAGYPLSERESWTAKAIEAQSITGGQKPDPVKHPLIMTEAMFSGGDPAAIAAVVLAKAALFGRAAGAISGIRQAALADIEAASSAEAVKAALDRAHASAEAAFAGLMK